MTDHLTIAKQIAKQVLPACDPEASCMLVAAAIAGLRGYTMRHIRIGALAHKTKFNDQPYLAMRGGWGLAGMDAAAGKIYVDADEIDEDGGFNGHTWIEPEPELVLDLMHDVEDGAREEYDESFSVVGRYIPRPKLERLVKRHWRREMALAMKLGKEAARHA